MQEIQVMRTCETFPTLYALKPVPEDSIRKLPQKRVEVEAALHACEQKTDRTKALERSEHRSQGPAHHTRSIPREIQRTVWQRDAGQCAYTAPSGHRCQTRINLQFDHIQPWAMGGSSHTSTNIRLLCAAHNRWRTPAMGRRLPRPDPTLK